jgi:hypothetical protein
LKSKIQKIAGTSFDTRLAKALTNRDDLLFEAESFFGTDQTLWHKPMIELLINFEEDLIGEEIVIAMHELKQAEKMGDQTRVMELAKKCQVLSIRKAEVRNTLKK